MSRSRLAWSSIVALTALTACSVEPVHFTPLDDGGTDGTSQVSLVVSATALTVGEGATTTFTVGLDGVPSGSVLVNLAPSDGSVIGVMPTALLFEAGSAATTQTVTVTGRSDEDAADGVASIAVSSPVGGANIAVTVEDDDELHVVVTPETGFQVDEGGTAPLAVRLSAAPSAPVTVVVGGFDPAVANASPTMLTFLPATWSLDQTVAISGLDDADIAHESTAVTLTATGLAPVEVSIAVIDDDVLGIQPMPTSLNGLVEGGTATFTVALTQQPTASVTIDLSSSDTGVATVAPTTLSFTTANWSSPRTVTVTLPQDVDLADEMAQIDLAGPTPIVTRHVPLAVADDDAQVIDVTPSALAVTEGQSRTADVRLRYQPAADVVVAVTTLNTALATASPASLTFNAATYAQPQTVTVAAPQDADAANGTTQLHLSSTASMLVLDVPITVTDDDPLQIDTTATAVSLSEGTTAAFGVRLTAMPPTNVTVNISSGDPSAATITPQTLTFTPANYGTDQTVTVGGVDDLDLAAETVTITLAATGLPTRTVTATVSDPDVQQIDVSSAAISVNEGSTGTVGVSLHYTPAGNVTVSLSSSDATAASVSPASLVFTPANHATPQTITIAGVDDPDPTDETATITLAAPGPTTAAVAVTVNDNDPLGIETSVTTLTVGETATQTFSVRLTAQPTATTTVAIATSDAGAATAAPSSLTFTTANYAAWQTVSVTGIDDADPNNETVTFSVSASGFTTRTVTATVTDNDPQSIVTSASVITVVEGASGTFSVRLAAMPAANVTVAVTSADITQATASPASLTFTPANYATDQTVTISGVDDLDLATDTVAITLSASGFTTRSVTATVTNSDTQTVLASPAGPLTITEGSSATVGVRLQYVPSGNVTVSMAAGTGVSASPTTLAFTPANYATSQNVTISALTDADTADVSTSITASAPSATSATVSITVDDQDVLAIETDASSLGIVEGATATLRVRLMAQPSATTPISVSSSDTSAATAAPSSLSFTPSTWSTWQNVTVTAVHDVDIANEGVTLTLSGAGSRSIGVTVTDDDQVTILATPASLAIDEPATGTFTVSLSNQPAASISVALASNDVGAATVSPTSIAFTTADWSMPRTVTVTGVADADALDESVSVALTGSGAVGTNVAVTVRDDELVLTDLSAQMGPAGGGTSLTALGGGFNASTTIALGGRALTSPTLLSSAQLSGVTQSGTRFVDAVATKGTTTATIPRAYYHGTWELASGGLSGGTIYAIVTTGASTVYAASDSGVFRSTDNGATWSLSSTGLSVNGAIRGLAVDPTNDQRLYAATGDGIFVTTNGGATWALAGTLTQGTTCVSVAPSSAATLYACAGGTIYRSTNSGLNWSVSASGLDFPFNVSFSSQDANVAYASSQGGVVKTTNGGASWSAINSGLPSPAVVYWVTANPTDANVVYAASWTGVYKTTNGGTSWASSTSGLNQYPSAFAIHASAPSTIVAATSNGMYRSTDAGATWVGPAAGTVSMQMKSVAIRASSSSDVYAGAIYAGIYRSTNTGISWSKSDTGLSAYTVMGVAPHPTINGTAFAMVQGMGLWKTTDRGATWAPSYNGISGNIHVTSLAFTPGAPATMYAGINGAGVYKSTDGAATWSTTGLTSISVTALLVDPVTTTTVYAATTSGVYRSTNGGATWSAVNGGISGTYTTSLAAIGSALYVVEGNNGIYKSTDGANSWTLASNGLPASGVRTVAVTDASGTLYAQAYSGTYRSADGGTSWAQVASATVAVVVDPTRPDTAYVAGSSSPFVRRTLTAFATAVSFGDGAPQTSDATLAVDRGGATVYLGTFGRGLWRVSN
jgi:hypothetical protein